MGLNTALTYELSVTDLTLDAATTGRKSVLRRIVLPTAFLTWTFKSGKLILSYVWPATADGVIELYNYTDTAVVAQTSAKTGGESSVREEVSIVNPDLLRGKELGVTVNITTAGAGETVKVRGAVLEILLAG